MSNFLLNMVQRGAGVASTVMLQPIHTATLTQDLSATSPMDLEPEIRPSDEAIVDMTEHTATASAEAQGTWHDHGAVVQPSSEQAPVSSHVPEPSAQLIYSSATE